MHSNMCKAKCGQSKSKADRCVSNMTGNSKTHFPKPFVGWMSFADVDNNKVCHLLKLPNDFCKIVHKRNHKRWSGTAAEV